MLKSVLIDLIKTIIKFMSNINDYIIFREITLSEVILYIWSIIVTIWYLIFGVVSCDFDYVFPESVWISFFIIMSISHTIGIFFNNMTSRLTALYGYVIAWGILAIFDLWRGSGSPAFPAYFLLFITSLFIVFRLREKMMTIDTIKNY